MKLITYKLPIDKVEILEDRIKRAGDFKYYKLSDNMWFIPNNLPVSELYEIITKDGFEKENILVINFDVSYGRSSSDFWKWYKNNIT